MILVYSDCFFKEFPNIDKDTFINNISVIYLQNSNIKNIKFFKKFYSLKEMYLDNNDIDNIDNISYFNNLETLSLTYNLLTHIDLINKLHNLTYLDLSYNKINNIFFSINKLRVLNINNNKLNNFIDLSICPKLEKLHINNNKITYIDKLISNSIKYIDISYNNIKKINIRSKKDLPFLNILDLTGNELILHDICMYDFVEKKKKYTYDFIIYDNCVL